MSLLTQAGNFTLNTAVGNQSITGVGFRPKVVFFYPTKMTADGVTEHTNLGFGVAVSDSERGYIAGNDEDGQGTTDCARYQSDANCLALLDNGAATRDYEADFVSMDEDGFTINIGNAPGTAYRVGYLAIGGSDLVDQTTGAFTGNNAIGEQAVTGLGFQPDAVIFFNASRTSVPSGGGDLILGMGWAISPSKRGWTAVASDNGLGTSDTARQQRTDACIGVISGAGAVSGEADFVSFDTDGFTVNWSNAANHVIFYVALRGGQYDCGSLNSQTAVGTFSQTGVGFTPEAAMFMSYCAATAGSEQEDLKLSLGLTSSSTERFVAGGTSEDGQGTSDCDSFSDDGNVYQNYNFAQGLRGAFDLESFDSDGFTLNQTTVDTSNKEVLWFVMGSQPPVELAAIDTPVPRGLMFVEQVKFTEPYSLQLIGGDDQRFETFLAQKGIKSEDDLRDGLDSEYHPQDRPIITPYPPEVRPPGGSPGVLYPCGQIPIGGIIMWSGAIADIPECWALCDGTPPTPDLRKKFITGASMDAPDVNWYEVGETGGADEVDISHQHGAGTLVADNESAHTHGIGTYAAANESAHTHGDGTYAAANDTHNHADTFTIDNDAHTHDVTGWSSGESAHTHGAGSYVTPASVNPIESDDTGGNFARDNVQTSVTGTSGVGSSHSHADGTYAAASDTHNHGISGSVSNDTHNHDVTGTSGAGSAHTHTLSGTSGTGSAHGHQISGNTATGGDTTHDNRPQFYALAFIMRTS